MLRCRGRRSLRTSAGTATGSTHSSLLSIQIAIEVAQVSESLANGFPEAYQHRSVNGYRPIGIARPHHEFPPCERSDIAASQVIDDVQPIFLARDPFLNQHGVA